MRSLIGLNFTNGTISPLLKDDHPRRPNPCCVICSGTCVGRSNHQLPKRDVRDSDEMFVSRSLKLNRSLLQRLLPSVLVASQRLAALGWPLLTDIFPSMARREQLIE